MQDDPAALDAVLATTVAIAREAGALMRSRYESRAEGEFALKGRHDYLTEVDGEVERFVVARLEVAFPGDGIVGEEGASRPGDRLWIIDPIDGTSNFARGIGHFCISIALVRQQTVLVGVIHDPMRDETFAARRGGGATLNGRPMRVSGATDMGASSVECGWSTRHPASDYVAVVSGVMEMGAGMYRCGSGALGMAYVAAGRIDAYCELHINAWDVLAGVLLVEEAGGRCSPFMTGPWLTEGNPILGATPGLYEALSGATGIR